MKKLLTQTLLTLLIFLPACAEESETKNLTREKWESYFATKPQAEVKWQGTYLAAIFGKGTYEMISRYKGEKEGWQHFSSLIVGGFLDGDQGKGEIKIDEKGMWTRKDGKVTLNIPFPLKEGQEWKAGEKTMKVISLNQTRETPSKSIDHCIIITQTNQEKETSKKWYAPGVGLIFIESDLKGLTMTRKRKGF